MAQNNFDFGASLVSLFLGKKKAPVSGISGVEPREEVTVEQPVEKLVAPREKAGVVAAPAPVVTPPAPVEKRGGAEFREDLAEGAELTPESQALLDKRKLAVTPSELKPLSKTEAFLSQARAQKKTVEQILSGYLTAPGRHLERTATGLVGLNPADKERMTKLNKDRDEFFQQKLGDAGVTAQKQGELISEIAGFFAGEEAATVGAVKLFPTMVKRFPSAARFLAPAISNVSLDVATGVGRGDSVEEIGTNVLLDVALTRMFPGYKADEITNMARKQIMENIERKAIKEEAGGGIKGFLQEVLEEEGVDYSGWQARQMGGEVPDESLADMMAKRGDEADQIADASKKVEEAEEGAVFYRGTDNVTDAPFSGKRTFMTPDKKLAEKYGKNIHTYKVPKDAKIFDASKGADMKLFDEFIEETGKKFYRSSTKDGFIRPLWTAEEELTKWLKKKKLNYDGIYFAEGDRTLSLAMDDMSRVAKEAVKETPVRSDYFDVTLSPKDTKLVSKAVEDANVTKQITALTDEINALERVILGKKSTTSKGAIGAKNRKLLREQGGATLADLKKQRTALRRKDSVALNTLTNKELRKIPALQDIFGALDETGKFVKKFEKEQLSGVAKEAKQLGKSRIDVLEHYSKGIPEAEALVKSYKQSLKSIENAKSELDGLVTKAKGSVVSSKGIQKPTKTRAKAKKPSTEVTSKTTKQVSPAVDSKVSRGKSLPAKQKGTTPEPARPKKAAAKKSEKVPSKTEAKKEISLQEQTTEIKDKIQATRFAVGRSGDLSPRNLKAEAEKIIKKQSDKIPDDAIRATRNEMLLGEESLGEIVMRKRGIISDKEALERAKKLKISTDDILSIPKGTTLNKEQITAVRQVLATEREINKNLLAFIDSGAGLDKGTRRYIDKFKDIEGFKDMSDQDILLNALQESTSKLKQLEIVNLALGSEAGRALQALKQNVPAVDQKMRAIWARMKKLSKEKQQEMTEMLGKINIEDPVEYVKFLDSMDNPTIWEKIAEFSTAAKLWMPTTHLVNFGGNALRQVADFAIKSVVSPKTIAADVAGMRAGLATGSKNFMKAMTDEGYAKQLSKFIEESGRTSAIKGKVGEAVRLPFRLLGASDEIFNAVAYNRSLYRDAHKSGNMKEFLKNPPLEAMSKATKEAQRMTFQEPMDKVTRMINQFRDPANFDSNAAQAGATVARLFLPFLKTPTNIFKQAFDFSPLTFAKNFKEIKKGSELGKTLVAEGVAGSALAMHFVSLANQGLVTGAAPKNKAERDTFYLDKQPYSIKVGDKWYSYSRIDPIATTLGLAVDLNESYSKEGAASLVGAVVDGMSEKTYLQGIKDLTDLFAGEDWERERAMTNAVFGGSIPSIVSGVGRAVDPTIRDTKGSKVAQLKSRLPFLTESLPAKVDILGDVVKRDQAGFEAMLNPIRTKGKSDDQVRNKIIKEFSETGYSASLPFPSRNTTIKGVQHSFTPHEYELLSLSFGNNFKDGLNKYISSPEYKTDAIEDRVDKFDKIKSSSAKKARSTAIKFGKIDALKKGKFEDGRDFMDTLKLMAEATKSDPLSVAHVLFSGDKIRKMENGSIIVERMSTVGSETEKLKRGSFGTKMKLDHTVPLQLGGTNDNDNLELVEESQWKSFTPKENEIGRKFRAGEISEKDAKKEILEFKESIMSKAPEKTTPEPKTKVQEMFKAMTPDEQKKRIKQLQDAGESYEDIRKVLWGA